IRDMGDRLRGVAEATATYNATGPGSRTPDAPTISPDEISQVIAGLEKEMQVAAKSMEFERAALLRDQIYELRAILSSPDNPLGTLATSGNGSQVATATASRAARSPGRYGNRKRR
ncbi:MAG: hypothetical protein EBV53_07605, partial [Proteobacteria bacterium]|nr:hypothetical protein [Pseudomonadota bacterium]